jgi:hypothetical protein
MAYKMVVTKYARMPGMVPGRDGVGGYAIEMTLPNLRGGVAHVR